MASLNANDTDSAYDVFISYQWDIQASAINLYDQLTKVHGLKCWMDIYDMTGSGDLNARKELKLFITVCYSGITLLQWCYWNTNFTSF